MSNNSDLANVAGQPAMITYVPELNMFRGRFTGLSGYCDFVSDSVQRTAYRGCTKRARFRCANTWKIVQPPALIPMLSRKKLRPLRCAIPNRWESACLRLLRKMKPR